MGFRRIKSVQNFWFKLCLDEKVMTSLGFVILI